MISFFDFYWGSSYQYLYFIKCTKYEKLHSSHPAERTRRGLNGRCDCAVVVLRDVPLGEPHAGAEQADQREDPEQAAKGGDGATA